MVVYALLLHGLTFALINDHLFFEKGNEEVKLANLYAISSWAIRSSDAVDSELVSFFSSGLKEKEALRRGHLRCLRIVSGNGDAIIQVN